MQSVDNVVSVNERDCKLHVRHYSLHLALCFFNKLLMHAASQCGGDMIMEKERMVILRQ